MSIKLPRLPVGYENTPGLFSRYWDQAMTSIEKNINDILVIPAIQAAILAAQTAADTANTAAASAQTAADSANSATLNQALSTSLMASFVEDGSFTAPLLSADASGSVTVASHIRTYGDVSLNPSVAVTGGVLSTAAAPGSVVRVYYSDASRSGGAVTYLFSVDPAPGPVQTNDTHSVGAVEVPVVGTFDGRYVRPPGFVRLD